MYQHFATSPLNLMTLNSIISKGQIVHFHLKTIKTCKAELLRKIVPQSTVFFWCENVYKISEVTVTLTLILGNLFTEVTSTWMRWFVGSHWKMECFFPHFPFLITRRNAFAETPYSSILSWIRCNTIFFTIAGSRSSSCGQVCVKTCEIQTCNPMMVASLYKMNELVCK